MDKIPIKLGIEYTPDIVKISAKIPVRTRMWGR
jgi:hypothetical protein